MTFRDLGLLLCKSLSARPYGLAKSDLFKKQAKIKLHQRMKGTKKSDNLIKFVSDLDCAVNKYFNASSVVQNTRWVLRSSGEFGGQLLK